MTNYWRKKITCKEPFVDESTNPTDQWKNGDCLLTIHRIGHRLYQLSIVDKEELSIMFGRFNFTNAESACRRLMLLVTKHNPSLLDDMSDELLSSIAGQTIIKGAQRCFD